MLRRRTYVRLSIALAYTSLTLLTTSAYGQSPPPPANPDNEVVAAQGPRLSNRENKTDAAKPRSSDLESEVAAVKAENAAVRELLRKMEEQQKALLEQVDRLQRRLDGSTATDLSIASQPTALADTSAANAASTSLSARASRSATVSTSAVPRSVCSPPARSTCGGCPAGSPARPATSTAAAASC